MRVLSRAAWRMGEARSILLVLGLLALGTIGCGGGDSTRSSGTTSEGEAFLPWVKGPTREFLDPDSGDNAVQTFGREATEIERAQATRVIAAWMAARAAQRWKEICSHFSRRYAKELTADGNNVTEGRVKTCPQAVAYFGPAAATDFKNNNFGEGPLDSLRVEDGFGYAQYHGSDGKDWVVPVDRDVGRWKVSIAAPINRYR